MTVISAGQTNQKEGGSKERRGNVETEREKGGGWGGGEERERGRDRKWVRGREGGRWVDGVWRKVEWRGSRKQVMKRGRE